jgi:hypothetical protein
MNRTTEHLLGRFLKTGGLILEMLQVAGTIEGCPVHSLKPPLDILALILAYQSPLISSILL